MHDLTTNRRRFLVAAITFSGLALGTIGPPVLRLSQVWAQSGNELDQSTLDAMVRMARLLFPHDALSDKFYGDVLDSALSSTAGDPSISKSLNSAGKALDAARPGNWIDLDEADQLAVMREVDDMGFFTAIQGAVRAGIYLHPVFWKHIGYPGPSKEHGGYLHRGSDDIDWLPGDR